MIPGNLQAIILMLCCLAAKVSFAQSTESGFVLLSNDRYLEGRVEVVADRYVITRTAGNQVSIPRNQVQFVGSNKQELYRFKARSLSPIARAGDHFKLAKWCLSMQLLAEAGQHYLKVIQTHPPETNPSVKRLGVEIKDAMLQQAEFRTYLGLAPISRPDSDGQVVASSGAISQVVAANSTTHLSVDQLPAQVKALFADQIQHILLNRCGQASCHGHASGNTFQLVPVQGNEAVLKTADNIESVLRFINHSPAGRAAFIEFATKAHGRRDTPPIQSRETNLIESLDRWLAYAQSRVVTAEATAPSNSGGLRPVLPGSPQYRTVPNSVASVDTGVNRIEALFPVGVEVPTVEEIDALDKMLSEQLGFPPLPENGNSRDPFDPAEFNRQRAARRQQFQALPDH